MKNDLTLIIAPKGKTSSRVIKRYEELGLNYRGVSRSSEIPFDWYNPETWKSALEGITKAYLVFTPDLAVPGSTEIITEFMKMCDERALEKVVLLSGRGEEEAKKCEDIVLASKTPSTVVRASWFSQNFSESFFYHQIMSGKITVPVHKVKEPFIDVEDIADVVFFALQNEESHGKVYEVTGPELLSFPDIAKKFSEELGREISFEYVTIDEFMTYLKAAQTPKEYIDLLHYLFVSVLDGRNESIQGGVEEALGRAPKSFTEYIRENKKAWEI